MFSLPTLICTGRQAGATPRSHGDIQPLRAARLSDISISVSACPHFSLRECENFRLSVSSSSVCIPLFYLGFDHTLPSLFSAACYLITCASVFAAGLFPSPTRRRQAALYFYRLHQPSCCLTHRLIHPTGGAWRLQPAVFSLSFTRQENKSCQPGIYSGEQNDYRYEKLDLFHFVICNNHVHREYRSHYVQVNLELLTVVCE